MAIKKCACECALEDILNNIHTHICRNSQLVSYAKVKDSTNDYYRNQLITKIIEWSRLLECNITNDDEITAISKQIASTYQEWKLKDNAITTTANFRRRSSLAKIELVLPSKIETLEEEMTTAICCIGILMILKTTDSQSELWIESRKALITDQHIMTEDLAKFINAALVSVLNYFWSINSKVSKAKQEAIDVILQNREEQASPNKSSAEYKGVKWIELNEEEILMREQRNENIRVLSLPTTARKKMIKAIQSLPINLDMIDVQTYYSINQLFKNWCNESQYSEGTCLLGPDRLAHKISKLEIKLTITLCNIVLVLNSSFDNVSYTASYDLLKTVDNFNDKNMIYSNLLNQLVVLIRSIENWINKRNNITCKLAKTSYSGQPIITPAVALMSAAKEFRNLC